MKKNKISTLGYFSKRLKDNDYVVWKMFDKYPDDDYRKWTVLVNPGQESVFISCLINRDGLNESPSYDFYDGGRLFQKNYTVQTESMEIIINTLINHSIQNNSSEYKKHGEEET